MSRAGVSRCVSKVVVAAHKSVLDHALEPTVPKRIPKAIEVIHAHLVHGDSYHQCRAFAQIGLWFWLLWDGARGALHGLGGFFGRCFLAALRHLLFHFILFPHAVLHLGLLVHLFAFGRLLFRGKTNLA